MAIVVSLDQETVDFIVRNVSSESPLMRVMPHVLKRQLERAYTWVEMDDPETFSFTKVRLEAEKEIVRLYVTDDFCGLCGRYTDHVGEH